MKELYIQVKSDKPSKHIWFKFILNKLNDLSLGDVIRSLNQYMINNNPTNVFFDYPNILFDKYTHSIYINDNEKNRIDKITTIEQKTDMTLSFNSYNSFKNAIIILLPKDMEERNNNGSDSRS